MPNDPSDVAFDDGWEALLETATLVDVRGAGELEADGSLPDALIYLCAWATRRGPGSPRRPRGSRTKTRRSCVFVLLAGGRDARPRRCAEPGIRT